MLQPTGINRNTPDSQGTKFDFHKKDQICHIWGCRISSILEKLHFTYFKFGQNNYTWINENIEYGTYFQWLPWRFKHIIINVDKGTRMVWFQNSPKLTINCKHCFIHHCPSNRREKLHILSSSKSLTKPIFACSKCCISSKVSSVFIDWHCPRSGVYIVQVWYFSWSTDMSIFSQK